METFSENATSFVYDFSQGCEHQLVQSCSDELQLSINVDFLQDNFASGRLLINYKNESLYIHENFTVSSVGDGIDYMLSDDCDSVTVTIASIGLTVARTESDISVSFSEVDDGFPFITGICGSSSSSILLPNCITEVDVSDIDNITMFIDSFKVPASEQTLHKQREECGM